MLGLAQVEARTAHHHVVAVFDEIPDQVAHRQQLRPPVHQRDVVHGERRLQGRILEQRVEHHARHGIVLEDDDDPQAVAVRLVVDVGDAVDLLVVDHVGDLPDHFGLVDHVGNLRYHDALAARRGVLDFGLGAHDHAAAAGEHKSTEKNESTKKVAPVEKFSLNNEDRQLSGSFERNRGILPVPITGPYVIVSHYGQYAVDGLRNVKLDNKGIDIKGKPGAQARAVFNGEVSAIFQYNGLNNILVRHGNYISVYCNLSSVSVSKGSKVNTRTVLGTIHTDSSGNTVLHFQLRKETAKLNPELWLGR